MAYEEAAIARQIGLASPASELATPPIHPTEAVGCKTAVCRVHGGHRFGANYGDKEGDVLFCALGLQYWRYTKQASGMHAPLAFPKGL